MAGFEEPTSGEILLNGAGIQHLKPYQRNVSTVFQNYALFPHLTVRENIEFGLRRRAGEHIEERVAEVLELVQLSGQGSRGGRRRYREASGSAWRWRGRWCLRRTCCCWTSRCRRSIRKLRKQVRAELKQIQRRVGITFLFVTHDQEEALSMSDRLGS